MASLRRKKTQSGSEMIEFAFVSLLLVPMFLGMFITGMNLIRIISVRQMTASVGSMYIKGADFSTYNMQLLARRLAGGLGLQIGSFTGNKAQNGGNAGNGVVILTQITYIGTPTCATLPTGTACTNQNKYVFTQRIVFGNSSQKGSSLGNPTATVDALGRVANYITDGGAVCGLCNSLFPTQLTDGQYGYVSEVYFASPDLDVSALSGQGVYARVIM
jgi:hypothetical protein